MKNFSSTEIRFSGYSIKSCIVFIDLVDSTKNIMGMDKLEHIRIYYSKFMNSVSEIVKNYGGQVIKNVGDCLLLYFPKTSDNKNERAFREVIECGLKILDSRDAVNQELLKEHVPPFSYKISMDFGILDLALVGDYSQIDLFGSTVNLCSKINSSLSSANQIIIGDNFYRILKSFPNIASNYNFINNGECKVTETIRYSTYKIKKINELSIDEGTKYSLRKKMLGFSTVDFTDTKRKKDLYFPKKNTKRIILVDDNPDILFSYELILKNSGYEVISFTDPFTALNFIKDLPNFNDLLVTLDVRMKGLNGFQLQQQINLIDPTIKILFITGLDISDEILTIVPGLTKEQILMKPVEKKVLISTVKKLL